MTMDCAPGFSVLVAAFNVEATIGRCIDSIAAARKGHEVELIVLDDGSTDRTAALCAERAAGLPWIRLITQQNAGIAEVRNRLIREARGTYLAFVDGDHAIEPHYFDFLDEQLRQSGADMVVFGHTRHTLDGQTLARPNRQLDLDSDELAHMQLRVSRNVSIYMLGWARVFTKELADGFVFDRRIKLGSDTAFNIHMMNRARHVRVVAEPLYHYYESPGSITSTAYKPALLESFEAHYRARLKVHAWPDAGSADHATLKASIALTYVEYVLMYLLNNVRYLPIGEQLGELKRIRHSVIYQQCVPDYVGRSHYRGVRVLVANFIAERYWLTLAGVWLAHLPGRLSKGRFVAIPRSEPGAGAVRMKAEQPGRPLPTQGFAAGRQCAKEAAEARKYTVIVAAYNAAATLGRCLDSIHAARKSHDVECIVINDGSVDRTAEVCGEYVERYPWIRYVEQENGGEAAARNSGLSRAMGTHIASVDSDDTVNEDFFDFIDGEIEKTGADAIIFGHTRVLTDGARLDHPNVRLSLGRDEVFKLQLQVSDYKSVFFLGCVRVYARSLVEGVRYDPRIRMGPDTAHTITCMNRANHIEVYPNCIYNYYENPYSATSGKFKPGLLDSFEIHYRSILNAHQWPEDEIGRSMLAVDISRRYMGHILLYLLNNLRFVPRKERMSELRRIRASVIYTDCVPNYRPVKPSIAIRVLVGSFARGELRATLVALEAVWWLQKLRDLAARSPVSK